MYQYIHSICYKSGSVVLIVTESEDCFECRLIQEIIIYQDLKILILCETTHYYA